MAKIARYISNFAVIYMTIRCIFGRTDKRSPGKITNNKTFREYRVQVVWYQDFAFINSLLKENSVVLYFLYKRRTIRIWIITLTYRRYCFVICLKRIGKS